MTPFAAPVPPSKWRLRRWWNRTPRRIRFAGLALFAVLFASGGYYWFVNRAKAAERQRIAAEWIEFDKAARALDDDGMKKALDTIAETAPHDLPTQDAVRIRRQAINDGIADPNDAGMAALTVYRHVRVGRWADAEREADKRLKHEPDDWVCRCAKVAAALARDDRAAANRLVDALPDPAAKTANATPDGILFAAELFRALGRDPERLRAFLRAVIVDRLRALVADNDPPAVTAKLLLCYLEAFNPTEANPAGLALAVADIHRLLGSATAAASAANDTKTLLQLGTACERLFDAWTVLLRDKAITPEQFKSVRADHQERTRAVWQALKDRAPKEPQAYRGLALAFDRDGDVRKATETVIEGLTAAGEDPALLAMLTVLLQVQERADLALRVIAEAADRQPDSVPVQIMAAEAAAAIGRTDLLLIACERVYKTQPRHAVAARLEAGAKIRAGDPHGAMQALAERIGEDKLAEDPTAARWYVRARAEAVGIGLEPFFKKCEDNAVAKRNPLLIASALAGIVDATFDAERTATAERIAARCLDRTPNDGALLRVRAALLARRAELEPPVWAETRLRPAVTAYSELRRKAPEDLDVSAALAWLRLKGEKNTAQAVDAAGPLIATDARHERLTPRQYEILGAVYTADGKLDPAVRALEAAVGAAPTPAGRIHLALAYLKRGRVGDARATLQAARAARTGPWSDQDEADYRQTFEALQRENR